MNGRIKLKKKGGKTSNPSIEISEEEKSLVITLSLLFIYSFILFN